MLKKLPSKGTLVAISILYFIALAGLQLFLIEQHTININFLIVDTIISLALILISLSILFFIQKYSPSYIQSFVTRIIFILALIFGNVFLQKLILSELFDTSTVLNIFNATFVIRLTVVLSVITFFALTLWFLQFIKEQHQKNKLSTDAENMLRQAELIKLRQQIQPHFLFNSLNSINALVIIEPQQARLMIQNLSDFLRGTLKKDENKTVLFSEEIRVLKLYLEIEKVRFGNRLSVNYEINDDTFLMQIPPLLLQPIVENAVKFGLYNILEPVEIIITAKSENNTLIICISNPFDESTSPSIKGEGFGLSLIQKRLQLMYHRADLLVIEKNNSIFKTTILIPQV